MIYRVSHSLTIRVEGGRCAGICIYGRGAFPCLAQHFSVSGSGCSPFQRHCRLAYRRGRPRASMCLDADRVLWLEWSTTRHTREKPERYHPGCWLLTANQRRRVGLKVHLAPNRAKRAKQTCAEQNHGARFGDTAAAVARPQLGDCEIAAGEVGDHNLRELTVRLRSK